MKIVFACVQCQASFTVDAALAGRTGRCRHCGHRMTVPAPSAPVAVAASRPSPAPVAGRAMSWKEAVTSQLGLKPISEDNLAALRPRPSVPKPKAPVVSELGLRPITEDNLPALRPRARDEDEEDDDPRSTYGLAVPRGLRRQVGGGAPQVLRKGVDQGVQSYRRFFNLLAKLSRWISERCYSLSIILLIAAIGCGMAGKHSLAILGLSGIVLLNLVGLAGDLVTLVLLSFRKNPIQGALFLVPPITLIYLLSDWPRYRATVGRIKLPAIMLCLVLVAYLFVPWLNGGFQRSKTLAAQVEGAVQSIEHNVGDSATQLSQKAKEARGQLAPQLDKAQATLGEAVKAGEKAVEAIHSGAAPAGGGGSPGPGPSP